MSDWPTITLELDANGDVWLTQTTGAGVQAHYQPPANMGPPWGQVLPSGVRTKVAKINSTALVALSMEPEA
jgi:hypothetical protein